MKKRTKAEQLVSAMRRGWVSPLKAALQYGCMSFNQRCNEWRRSGAYPVKSRKSPSNARVVEFRIA